MAVCVGKDCRRRTEFDAVRRELSRCDRVREIGCIGVCAGPVVVVDRPGSTPLVFARLRRTKDPRRVVRFARRGGNPSGKLRDRWLTGNAYVSPGAKRSFDSLV